MNIHLNLALLNYVVSVLPIQINPMIIKNEKIMLTDQMLEEIIQHSGQSFTYSRMTKYRLNVFGDHIEND
jgi:hypothetical protein